MRVFGIGGLQDWRDNGMSLLELDVCRDDLLRVDASIGIDGLGRLDKHLAELLVHGLVEHHVVLLIVDLLVSHLLRADVGRSHLLGHPTRVILHRRLRSNRLGADHHATVNAVVLVHSI